MAHPPTRDAAPLSDRFLLLLLRMVQKSMSIVRTSPVVPPDQRPAWDSLVPVPLSRVSERRPAIVGHRGAAGLAPDNTLPAFQVAIDLGIDGVELDVQRSADGHLVVFHDDKVDKQTNGKGSVFDFTLDQLKALDAGSTFDARFAGERIATLREVFDLMRSSELIVNIELKDPWRYDGIEAEVVALVREFDLVERVCVRSFYHDALHNMVRLAPEIALSELWLDRLPGDDEVIFKAVNALHSLFTTENIARLHARGQLAEAWTVNDPKEARRLQNAGIDAITTNFPDKMLALFGS